jgi:hypothetical protein
VSESRHSMLHSDDATGDGGTSEIGQFGCQRRAICQPRPNVWRVDFSTKKATSTGCLLVVWPTLSAVTCFKSHPLTVPAARRQQTTRTPRRRLVSNSGVESSSCRKKILAHGLLKGAYFVPGMRTEQLGQEFCYLDKEGSIKRMKTDRTDKVEN